MRSARCRGVEVASALLFLVTVGVVVLFDLRPHRWPFEQLFDAVHGPLSAVVVWLAARLLEQRFPAWTWRLRLGLALTVALALGVAVEGVQARGGGEASLADLGRDLLGALAGGLILVGRRRGAFRWWLGAALIALGVCLWPAAIAVGQGISRWTEPTVVWQCRGLGQERRVLASGATLGCVDPPADWLGEPDGALRAELQTGAYPGFSLLPPFARWGAYRQLVLEIYSPAPDGWELGLRVDDRPAPSFGNRFDTTLRVAPGASQLTVPLAGVREGPDRRELDLDEVTRVVLYVSAEQAPRTFFLRRVWLR